MLSAAIDRWSLPMTYTLDDFVKDAQAALKAHNGPTGREQVRTLLEKLLANKKFVDEAVGPSAPLGTRKLYEDKDLGFVVLAHCNAKPHKSPPHDHGSSWAIYGQAINHTDMSEYRRLDTGTGAGDAKLEKVRSYRLEPGHAGIYDVGAIHAIDYPEGSRFVRVTGRDLDYVQRLKFDTAVGKAIAIESATAGSA
jgi:predicted metal-dependent enzyme (double-stranded beta helix superfamily)